MPELPEVETLRRDLSEALTGDRATRLEVLDRRLADRREETRWQREIPAQRWLAFRRHGKYLWAELERGQRLLFHLRMTGQLILDAAAGFGCHRLAITFSSGRTLHFFDQRRFGEVRLLDPGPLAVSRRPLGPDALNGLDRQALFQILRKKASPIHSILLDQGFIAGIGNIYSQEALFQAGIRPSRRGQRMKPEEWGTLLDHLRRTLQDAIALRGSSSRNYRDASGAEGQAQTRHQVYRKGGKPCVQCQRPLQTRRIGGRGCVFCPGCQS